jgi:hypothetical protein
MPIEDDSLAVMCACHCESLDLAVYEVKQWLDNHPEYAKLEGVAFSVSFYVPVEAAPYAKV